MPLLAFVDDGWNYGLRTKKGALTIGPPAAEPCCCCDLTGTMLDYWSPGSPYHCCDAAIYNCVGSVDGFVTKTVLGVVDLNNKARQVCDRDIHSIVTISAAQSLAILKRAGVKQAQLRVKLDCLVPPNEDRGWGLGKCHQQLAYLKVTRIDRHGNVVVLYDGFAGEVVIDMTACPWDANA